MTDISSETVERVRKYVDYPYTSPETLVVDSDLVQFTAEDLARIVQLVDAQAERIRELEAEQKGSRPENEGIINSAFKAFGHIEGRTVVDVLALRVQQLDRLSKERLATANAMRHRINELEVKHAPLEGESHD